MATAAAATSSFMGARLPDVHSNAGRVQARFGFGRKKAAPKKSVKRQTDRPLWFPGAKAPEWLDGSLVGDYGFDPFGLGKPAEYLQYDYDSLDQNLAKNVAGDVIGTRFEGGEVKSTPFQPYTEVFGLQRFRTHRNYMARCRKGGADRRIFISRATTSILDEHIDLD